MARRSTETEEWELHKNEIHRLFITKDHKISEVAELMTQRHGFTRTKAKYQTTLKRWGFNKNITKEDWLFVSEHVKKRKTKGRESRVDIRGITIPVKSLKKEMSRHKYNFTPFWRPMSDRNSPHPYIHIYTPPRSPEITPALSPTLPYLKSEVRRLLQRHVNVNAEPNAKKCATALQFAAINGNFEKLNMLLKAGANIHAPPASFDGRSAIEGASELGRLDMVAYLLGAGVNIRGKNNKNYRRSIYRAWHNGHRVLARIIQDWKAAKFGAEDCEDIETIYESVTKKELYYGDLVDADEMAREHVLGRVQGHVTSTSRNGI